MKNIAIFAKVQDPRCQDVADELVQWLVERGLTPLPEEHLARRIGFREEITADILDRAELVVVLGGTGPSFPWRVWSGRGDSLSSG